MTIGSRKETTDFVDALLECHSRIRSFVALARRLGESEDVPVREIAEAAASVRRYFTEALPQHVADEEESVLPRLRGRLGEIDAALDRMSTEHLAHRPRIERLVAACRTLESAPARHAEMAAEVASAAQALEAAFVPHLEAEERVIFPAIRTWMDPTELLALRSEARARRERPGPIQNLLAADHQRLNALLQQTIAVPGRIDREAYDQFRRGLLRHIAMEEKVLLPAAKRLRGQPLEVAAVLKRDHAALAALVVPTPTAEGVATIASVLLRHNPLEEGEGGLYAVCESLAKDEIEDLLRRLRETPEVRPAAHFDDPRVERRIAELLRAADRGRAPR